MTDILSSEESTTYFTSSATIDPEGVETSSDFSSFSPTTSFLEIKKLHKHWKERNLSSTSLYLFFFFLLLMSITICLLVSTACLIFLKKSTDDHTFVSYNRNEESSETEIGMLQNGNFIGKFSSTQNPNDLNFDNEEDGLLFFPFGEREEGEVLYECHVEVYCEELEEEEEEELFHAKNSIVEEEMFRRAGRFLQAAVFGLGVYVAYVVYTKHGEKIEEKATEFVDEKLSGTATNGRRRRCKAGSVDCQEVMVMNHFEKEEIWFCKGVCRKSRRDKKSVYCWGITEMSPSKVVDHSRKNFKEKCYSGKVLRHECTGVKDKNLIDRLTNDDRCENHSAL